MAEVEVEEEEVKVDISSKQRWVCAANTGQYVEIE